jgi:hypothetical protein
LPFVEFAYNKTVHSTTNSYGLNSFTFWRKSKFRWLKEGKDGKATPWESSTANREKKQTVRF